MNPDTILQEAAKEIADICDKYDIGGYIILASQTHGEYLLHFPKWSKAQLEVTPDGNQAIRFKSKGKDENKTVCATVHMCQVFQMQGLHISKGMDQLLEMLESKMFISGGPQKI
jgi:hypothetical protein